MKALIISGNQIKIFMATALLAISPVMYGQNIEHSINTGSISSFRNHDGSEYRDSNMYYPGKEKDFCIHQTYYKNGRLKSEYFTFKNKVNGPWRTWYPDGNQESSGYYFYGVPAGLDMTWYKNGRIESIGYYDTNTADTIYGIADSLKTKFIDCDTAIYTDNEPPYDVTDSIICTDNVLKNGRWVEYYENGALKSEKYFHRGIKVNTWKYYNKDGILIRKELIDHYRTRNILK